ncbi:DUF4056 domain-containing protein [Hafnia paralvei]|uniref:DUF4056 domain-containing protein n=1 Tax=Hafnia paralvei TaxID=546367 RepID=UPI001290F8D0|nr:DUF4056 domain-containing protein [Hafnia paralvei]
MLNIVKYGLFSLILLSSSCSSQVKLPIVPDLSTSPLQQATRAWPTVERLSAPDGLRPCCAFGYNLKAQALGIPVPLYQLNNVVEADELGEHHYNDSLLGAVANLMGISSEQDGLVYTVHGGFIDIAHVRDTADMTLFLFSQIWPRLGQEQTIVLSEELAQRQIHLFAFTPPQNEAERFTLAVYLSSYLAFQVAAWHEIAQWYGFESVPGFSEGISAFSPEDLYSNLLGARLASSLILQGHSSSVEQFNLSMQAILPTALQQLGAVSAKDTRFQFDMLDGNWWDSHRAVPEKFLVLKRNYETEDDRVPTPVPDEQAQPLRLQLPSAWAGLQMSALGELQLWPGRSMKQLPKPVKYYTFRDFPALALHARVEDAGQMAEMK